MTDGAETPPETPSEPTPTDAAPPLQLTRIDELEKGLKDLAALGKEAFDGLVARIQKLEDASLSATKPILPTGAAALPGRGNDKVVAEKEQRA